MLQFRGLSATHHTICGTWAAAVMAHKAPLKLTEHRNAGGVQGQDNDEVQQQPVWMQEGEGEEGGSPTASGTLPSLPVPTGGTPRSPASANGDGGGSGNLLSLSETPRANGGQPASPLGPAASSAPSDPLADLYSLGQPAPAQSRSPGVPYSDISLATFVLTVQDAVAC